MEISQVVTNMQHKTNIFRCVFQMNHIYYFFIALHKALSVFHTSCFLFKTFPPSFPSPRSWAEISPCVRPLRDAYCMRCLKIHNWNVFCILIAIYNVSGRVASYITILILYVYVINLSEHELNEEKRLVNTFAIICT